VITMLTTWIVPLHALEATLEIAGGKGANLGRLVRQGFPVPEGFIITTAAYRAYVERNKLAGAIQSSLEGLSVHDTTGLEAASEAIRARFAAGVLPEEIAHALHQAYAALGRPPVAVRSSATAEDLPGMSFAGQQDTFLNIVDDRALAQAVVGCWSSLWTARALGYRARHDVAQHDLALAVVVQEMVQSDASGVLFTANPLTGRRTEMVIEAALGLGEALVSGRVEPDRYVVDAGSGRVLERHLGSKTVSIRGLPGGGTQAQAEAGDTGWALSEHALAELVRLGQQVGRSFPDPQDVEWASADGRIYLLQSRPITSLFPLPAGMAHEPLQVLLSFGAVQGIMGPITPLGQDAILALFAGAAGMFGYRLTAATQRIVSVAAERLFIDITGLIKNRQLGRLLRRAMPMLEPSVARALDSLWDDPRLAPTERFGPRLLRRVVPLAVPVLGRLVVSWLRPDAERARFERQLEARAEHVRQRTAAAASLSERVALMEEMLEAAFPFLLPRFVPRLGPAMGSLNLLGSLGAGLPAGGHDPLIMTRGLPHNVTTEMDLALWRVAQAVRTDPEAADHLAQTEPAVLAADYLNGNLPRTLQAAVAGFLRRYGVRGPGEIDLGRPRWRENPTPIMQTLKAYLQIEDPDQAPDAAFERGGAVARAAIERLAEDLRNTPGGWLKARLARWAAARVRALAGLRESPKFWAVRMMGLVRQALLESGNALVEDGHLARSDDLFFLHLDELKALAAGDERDWPAVVRARRRAHADEGRRPRVPRVLLSDGRAFYEGMASPAEEGSDVMTGSPVSPGVVEGPVRVVLAPAGAALVPGEILVCPGTDPSWTPLFLVAGGLVMEVGGLMTHGSVVAREYGIPAVVGVSQATTRLKTGQRVRVDGSAGQVHLL
jgi:pyruvate,water dikinase